MLAAGCGRTPPEPPPLVVSAATSLRDVMVDVDRAYARAGGRVALNIGPSNVLARQIAAGAPVDVFISADEAQMDLAERADALLRGSRMALLSNQLVVVVPADRPRTARSSHDLLERDIRRIALGDPEAVPAGVYARRFLEAEGTWVALQSKLVPVGSVGAVLAAVEEGSVDAGFVYGTDARLSSRVRVALVVPPDAEHPIKYPAAVVRASKQPEEAKGFLLYLRGSEARAIFERFGFAVLGESPDRGPRAPR